MTTSVDVLCSQNILTCDEIVSVCLADDNQAKIKLLDDKLTAVSPSMWGHYTQIVCSNFHLTSFRITIKHCSYKCS